VDDLVRERLTSGGPLPFDEVMAAALYDPQGGFYASGGRAGRAAGDFITSPEVGPLFGAVVAGALDRWWSASAEPAVFTVVEAGAGPGTLAQSIVAAAPACGKALRYVLVEPSQSQRLIHRERLVLSDPREVGLSGVPGADRAWGGAAPAGPVVVSLAELPRLDGPCVVLANELLDNLPFGLAERREQDWVEIMVGLDGDQLAEVPLPAAAADVELLAAAAPHAPVGARLPIPRGARIWLREALALAGSGGRVVAFDYGRTAAELASWSQPDWLRTYRGHARGGPPLDALGSQDITAEVPFDLLGEPPSEVATQASWLRSHGIDELVAEGRRVWQERAAIGDLAAVRARSRLSEADALLDPAGLGGFLALEWNR
jgi:SAM-dependent MidA family methyltransferase